jgi:hypothetical protein
LTCPVKEAVLKPAIVEITLNVLRRKLLEVTVKVDPKSVLPEIEPVCKTVRDWDTATFEPNLPMSAIES